MTWQTPRALCHFPSLVPVQILWGCCTSPSAGAPMSLGCDSVIWGELWGCLGQTFIWISTQLNVYYFRGSVEPETKRTSSTIFNEWTSPSFQNRLYILWGPVAFLTFYLIYLVLTGKWTPKSLMLSWKMSQCLCRMDFVLLLSRAEHVQPCGILRDCTERNVTGRLSRDSHRDSSTCSTCHNPYSHMNRYIPFNYQWLLFWDPGGRRRSGTSRSASLETRHKPTTPKDFCQLPSLRYEVIALNSLVLEKIKQIFKTTGQVWPQTILELFFSSAESSFGQNSLTVSILFNRGLHMCGKQVAESTDR